MRSFIDNTYQKIFKRNDVYSAYNAINRSQYWDIERLKNHQINSFNALFLHCINNVPYYHELAKKMKLNTNDFKSVDDLAKLPLLTKDIIRKDINSVCAKNISRQRFAKNSTSGSTGSNFYFYSDLNQEAIKKALDMRRYDWMDVSYFDRELIIWGAAWDINNQRRFAKTKDWLKNRKKISGYRLSDKDILYIHKLLNSYKPNILKSYPSILTTIIDVFKKYDMNYQPQVIHIGGEKLHKYQKDKISAYFNAPVFDFYAARDMPQVAQECHSFNGLHVFMENVIVEVVDDNGIPIEEGEGDLVITNLHNYAMPFIRYKIGDRAKISKDRICKCGRNLQIIDEIIGRSFEVIRFPNGNQVGGTFWTLVMKSAYGIKEFQVIQETSDYIKIYYTEEETQTYIDLDKIKTNILAYSGEKQKIEFAKVKEIQPTSAGKMQFVISRIN